MEYGLLEAPCQINVVRLWYTRAVLTYCGRELFTWTSHMLLGLIPGIIQNILIVYV